MSYDGEKPEVITINGKFFDFALKSGRAVIMDYSKMDKEIVISATNDSISLGNPKQKKPIGSVRDLRKIMEEITSAVQEIINQNGVYTPAIDLGNDFVLEMPDVHNVTCLPEDFNYSGFKISAPFIMKPLPLRIHIHPDDWELFIDQLVFDILYDTYRKDSPQMTLRHYSMSHSRYVWGDVADGGLIADTVRKCVEAAIPRQIDIMNNTALREDIREFGVNPDAYFEYLSRQNEPFGKDETKPKIVWDYIYYSGTHKLNYRQTVYS